MNTEKSKKAWFFIVKESIMPMLIGAIVFTCFWLIYEKYQLSDKQYLDKTFFTFLILFVTFWVYKIVIAMLRWYAVTVTAKTKTQLDDRFIPLFKRLIVTVIWAISIIIILARFGVNINALVATLGVSSLAVALAAQDTIANIIAGFLIMVDRPFNVGDRIKLPSGEKVEVLDIGIRRSKFLSEDKAIIIVPNLELSKSKIVNYTYGGTQKQNV